MKNISILKADEQAVLFYRESEVDGESYLLTLRHSTDGRFISDDSILELWLGNLSEPTWVNPNMVQRFALEVYDKKNGKFSSVGPVIITDTEYKVTEELLEAVFSQVEKVIASEISTAKGFEKECLSILSKEGFENHFVGGGCSIPIR